MKRHKEEEDITNRRKAKELSNFKTFAYANTQGLETQFHSCTAKNRIYTVLNFFPSLFVPVVLSSNQN